MAISASHHIRALRGHTQPHLMFCEDGNPYVVKFRRNPQGCRALASEYLATRLAQWAELPLPTCSIIDVSHFIIQNTQELAAMIQPEDEYGGGLHFGSRLVGRLPGDTVVGYLPSSYLTALNTPSLFGGMLALDKWLANTDTRQAVFLRGRGDTQYRTQFIDQSQCFAGAKWHYQCNSTQGLFYNRQVYHGVGGWESFEPFVECFMSVSPTTVWAIAQEIPSEWYDGIRSDLEALVDSLLRRRSSIYALVARQRDDTPNLFPQWSRRSTIYTTSDRYAGSVLHTAGVGG